jgi:alkanesulfonate monooxygenase SsuD/methylene tetrahydromethanopterin reductase-like flavin-dependent oxidoreductase (luciferase family)
MKVNIAVSSHNSSDWDRVLEKRYDDPQLRPDSICIEQTLALGDLAEPLGFDGIWVPDHFATPYSMSPNPLQILAYFAGRTERVRFGTMVLVLPWWHPFRLAHQIAYLDIVSKGRYDTIGVGRGVAKCEFDPMGIPRDETRQRFAESLDILKLALGQEVFSYDGEIFKIPETSIRPRPITPDLFSRFSGASGTNTSLEVISRAGIPPLFIGNKPLTEAGKDLLQVNEYRREEGLPPTQSKNIMFMYCVSKASEARDVEKYILRANRDVRHHYGFDDPSTFAGVKGYEAYAAGLAAATGPLARDQHLVDAYDRTNLLIGTPEEIIQRIEQGQKECSFEQIALLPQFGGMPFEDAEASVRLFAQEVLPTVHKMDTPLSPACTPQAQPQPA